MFKIITLLAATCLAMPAGDDGATATNGSDQGRHLGQHRQEILAKFDADHDGKLSESERAAARAALAARLKEKHPKLFAKIDTNGDGQLSKEEMEAARAKLRELREKHQGGHGEHAQK